MKIVTIYLKSILPKRHLHSTFYEKIRQINTGMITEAQDLARYLVNNGYM